VPLEAEIDCINNYISLQKLRLGESCTIYFSVTGMVIGKKIPPLMLMTFVENAFKHGISHHEQTVLAFTIAAEDAYIYFFTKNKLFAKARNIERIGIGIANTKKRLVVLYPEKHILTIKESAGEYEVALTLYK
jgi:two-component system, LytTR family, sensor kinase